LTELEKSKLGCFVNGKCLNSILYADDLVLISASVSDLQLLFKIAHKVLDGLDLKINFNKCACLRIGKCFAVNAGRIVVNEKEIAWVKETSYLGISVLAGCRFACNWHSTKRNFFTTVNTIYSCLGSNPELKVILSLFQSSCIPILTYGIGALKLTQSEIQSFSFSFNNLFHKLFKTSNKKILEQCQFFCGMFNFEIYYDFLRFSFLNPIFNSDDKNVPDSLLVDDKNDFNDIFKKIVLSNLTQM